MRAERHGQLRSRRRSSTACLLRLHGPVRKLAPGNANDGNCGASVARTRRYQLPGGHHRRRVVSVCRLPTVRGQRCRGQQRRWVLPPCGLHQSRCGQLRQRSQPRRGSCILSGCTDAKPTIMTTRPTPRTAAVPLPYGPGSRQLHRCQRGRRMLLYAGCTEMGTCNYDPMSNLDNGFTSARWTSTAWTGWIAPAIA